MRIKEFGRGWLYHDVTGLQLAAKTHPSLRWYRRTYLHSASAYMDIYRYWLVGFSHVWIACWEIRARVQRALWYAGVLDTREGNRPSWRDLTWHYQRTWITRLNAMHETSYSNAIGMRAVGYREGYEQRAKDFMASYHAEVESRWPRE